MIMLEMIMTVIITIINDNHDNVGDYYDSTVITIINNHDNVGDYYDCDDNNNK